MTKIDLEIERSKANVTRLKKMILLDLCESVDARKEYMTDEEIWKDDRQALDEVVEMIYQLAKKL